MTGGKLSTSISDELPPSPSRRSAEGFRKFNLVARLERRVFSLPGRRFNQHSATHENRS
jgi:hypothetical protein